MWIIPDLSIWVSISHPLLRLGDLETLDLKQFFKENI